MSGLTLEQRKKLSDLISQYGISLTTEWSGFAPLLAQGPLARRVSRHV